VAAMVRQNGRVVYRVVQLDGCFVYLLDMPKRRAPPTPSIRSWLKSDVLFLLLSLHNGMPMAEVAGFLARDEKEVQEKGGGAASVGLIAAPSFELYCPFSTLMSRTESSSGSSKSTATIVACLPNRNSPSLAIRISSALGEARADEAITERATVSLSARTRTTAVIVTSNS
jgi:hypothetical protein